jgi:hypothetical protein
MKHNYFFIIIVSIALLGLACTTKQSPAAVGAENTPAIASPVAVAFKSVNYTKTILSELKIDGENPSVKLDFSLLKLDAPEPLAQLINQSLYNGKTPEAYRDDVIAGFSEQYTAQWANYSADTESLLSVLSAAYEEDSQIISLSPRFILIKRYIYEYTGGAHGNYENEYFVIDLEQIALLKLDDILVEGGRTRLVPFVDEALRDYAAQVLDDPIPPDETLSYVYFEDTVEIPEDVDFFLTAEGIGFQWDPYDIAAYVIGSIEVTIPYTKIQNLFNLRGHALITETN